MSLCSICKKKAMTSKCPVCRKSICVFCSDNHKKEHKVEREKRKTDKNNPLKKKQD